MYTNQVISSYPVARLLACISLLLRCTFASTARKGLLYQPANNSILQVSSWMKCSRERMPLRSRRCLNLLVTVSPPAFVYVESHNAVADIVEYPERLRNRASAACGQTWLDKPQKSRGLSAPSRPEGTKSQENGVIQVNHVVRYKRLQGLVRDGFVVGGGCLNARCSDIEVY